MLAENLLDGATLRSMMIFAVPILSVLGTFGWLTARTISENALKRRMIDQGMSADEIEQVLSAKSSRRSHRR